MGATQVATGITAIETQRRGYQAVSLDSMDTSSVPTVLAGSTLEVASALFVWSTDETPNASSWTAISTSSTVYIQCTPSGSAGSQILTTSYTASIPTYVASKSAWYTSTGSSIRVISQLYKGGTSSYQGKVILRPQPITPRVFGRGVKTLSDESYTILDNDGLDLFILSSTALGATRTLTLPTAADNQDRRIRVLSLNAHTSYDLIVDGEGAETINGTANWHLNSIYHHITLLCTGTEWIVEHALGTRRVYESTSDSTLGSSPTTSVWYNLGGSLTLEAGTWEISYSCYAACVDAATLEVTLSSANNSESQALYTTRAAATSGSGGDSLSKKIASAPFSDITLYLNVRFISGTPTNIGIYGTLTGTIIEARRIA